jgi:hypothetical protein
MERSRTRTGTQFDQLGKPQKGDPGSARHPPHLDNPAITAISSIREKQGRPAEGAEMASIYQRGDVLWGKWRQDGKVIRQSLGTRDKAEAKWVIKERMNQMVTSKRPTTLKVT